MKGVRGSNAVAQRNPLILGLLPLRGTARIGPSHLCQNLLISGSGRCRVVRSRNFCEKAALNYGQDFRPFNWLAPLILAGGKMVNRTEKIRILQRLALARLEGETRADRLVFATATVSFWKKCECLVSKGCLLDLEYHRR